MFQQLESGKTSWSEEPNDCGNNDDPSDELLLLVETPEEVNDERASARLSESVLFEKPFQSLYSRFDCDGELSDVLEGKGGGETREMVKEEVSFV